MWREGAFHVARVTIALTPRQCVHYLEAMMKAAALHRHIKVKAEYKPRFVQLRQDTMYNKDGVIKMGSSS